MARFLFVPYSAHGHVSPALVAAAALTQRSETVRMVVDERFRSDLATAQVGPVVTAWEHRPWSPPSWGPNDIATLARCRLQRWEHLRAVAAACARELGELRPDLVVADTMNTAPARMALRRGIPVVWLSTTHMIARRPGTVLINAIPELQPNRYRFDERYRLVGPLLVPGPRSRTAHDAATPLLVVSPGTVFARNLTFFRAVVDEFADTEWAVVMATGHLAPEKLGSLPANIRATRWIPQRWALAHATVFLTHGGMNSVQEALYAGVPMLLAPRNREQRATAHRLVALGLGRWASRPLRGAAEELRGDNQVWRAAQGMACWMRRQDGPSLAAELLMRATATAL